MDHKPKIVVLYDDVCVLCNGFISFLKKRDTYERFQFESMQDDYAKLVLNAEEIARMSSMVVVKDEQQYRRADAAIVAIGTLGGVWKCVYIGKLLPEFLRDQIYLLISKNRYRWFGKIEHTCQVEK